MSATETEKRKPQNDGAARMSELEKKIRKQVACEERAHRLVEQLLENPITENFLIEAGKLITSSHYQDVTEERAITKVCGYPVCSNPIKNVPKQKYKISLKTNKVYDISERKNFCSNQCFKASQYFACQIPTTPVWARDDDPPPNITLMDRTASRGERGKEMFTTPREELAAEVQQLEHGLRKSTGEKGSSEGNRLDNSSLDAGGPEVTSIKELAQQVSEMMLVDKPEDGSTSQTNPKHGGMAYESADSAIGVIHQETSTQQDSVFQGQNTEIELERKEMNNFESSSIAAVDSLSQKNADLDKYDGTAASSEMPHSVSINKTTEATANELEDKSLNPASSAGVALPKQSPVSENAPVENAPNPENAEMPHNEDGTDEGYDETIVETPLYPKKRVAPEMTVDKAEMLMALIDKRDRLKKQLQVAPKRPVKTAEPSKSMDLLSPLSIQIEPVQQETKPTGDNVEDLEKAFEEKLKTGNISEIKDLFSQITQTEKKESKRKTDKSEQSRLLSVATDENFVDASQSNAMDHKKEPDLCDTTVKSNHQQPEEKTLNSQSAPAMVTIATDKEDKNLSKQTDVKPSSAELKTVTTETGAKKSVKMNSASVIDNIRRLQGQSSKIDEDDLADSKPKVKAKMKSKKKTPITPVQLLKNVLEDWVTKDTSVFLKASEDCGSELSQQEFKMRYAALERRIDKMMVEEVMEDEADDDAVKRPQKKLPDYNQLRKDTQLFNLKVQELFTGSFKLPSDIVDETEDIETTEDGIKEKQTSAKPLLPLVDGRQQKQIRQRILMERLDKVLPDILGPMKISIEDVTGDLRNMVSTFHLTSENVLLKPAEWTLISYLLLQLLATRNRNIRESLDAKQSTLFIDIILNKIGSSSEEIRCVIQDLLQEKS